MTRERLASVRWYGDDFLAGCFDLTPEQRGVYITIISQMISEGGPIDDDDTRNARMSNCHPRTFRRIKAELIQAGKLHLTGDKLGQKRVQQDLSSELARRDKAVSNGFKGGIKSRLNREKPNEINKSAEATLPAKEVAKPPPKAEQEGKLPVPVPEPDYPSPNGDGYKQHWTREETDRIWSAGGPAIVNPASHPSILIETEFSVWKSHGFDLNRDIVPTVRALAANKPPGSIRSWKFFTQAIAERHADRTRVVSIDEARSRAPARRNDPFAVLDAFARGEDVG